MQIIHKILDDSLREARNDMLPENEVCRLFELLDEVERYADMFSLLMKYPRTICEHFESTLSSRKYNFDHKWNRNLGTLNSMSDKEWREDMKLLVHHTSGKISKIINESLKKK